MQVDCQSVLSTRSMVVTLSKLFFTELMQPDGKFAPTLERVHGAKRPWSFVASSQKVVANLPISLCCCNLSLANSYILSKLVTCRKPVDNKFRQSTCNKSFDNLQQVCRQQAVTSHVNASLYRFVDNTSVARCQDLLQLARFWLSKAKTSRH